MAIRIIIKRKVPRDKQSELLPLLMQLRTMATAQKGYISGETMRNVDDHEDFLVISTWNSVDDWKAWMSKREREGIQEKIDGLLKEKTQYGVYYYG